MEVELLEIRDFLAARPPFDVLPENLLNELVGQLAIRYLRRGSVFPPADEGPALYVVRSGAIELRNEAGDLIDKIGEGGLCPHTCIDAGEQEPKRVGHSVEDTLLYLLPCAQLERLQQRSEAFDHHFNDSIRLRLQSALRRMQEGHMGQNRLMRIELGSLINRAPIHVGPEATIRQAAQRMTEERVSSLLVMQERKLLGLITDRDLRSRVLAAGLDPSLPVTEIMTTRLHKATRNTPALEALLDMSRLGIHHLPVVDRQEVCGIITTSDLIRQESANAIYLLSDIRRAESPEELVELAQRIPELHMQLVAAGTTAHHLGEVISSVSDALSVRLLQLAEAKFGPAPVPYCWLAVGSQARREQCNMNDQDNALLLDDSYAEAAHGAYFTQLAEFVCSGLDACGLVFCPGGIMAKTPEWRQPLSVWQGHFSRWVKAPEPKAMMLFNNFIDARPLYGQTSLYDQLHHTVVKMVGENRIFLAHLTAHVLKYRPPLGFFRQFVLIHDGEHDNHLDIKKSGLIPIIDLARIHALAGSLPEVNSRDRLLAAADARIISHDAAEELCDALELISTLRARHHAELHKQGRPSDNYLDPDRLSSHERGHLKEAFKAVRLMQDALAARVGTLR